MASEVRARMIDGAAQLLARQGLQATSFSEVLELTGAPRGSVYHHFPEGKDQLVGAAVDRAGEFLLAAVDPGEGATAEQVVERFLAVWRAVLTSSDCRSGCAVVAVTVATDSSALLNHAAEVFRSWRSRLGELLEAGGLSGEDAHRFATVLVAAVEGAVVLSRADESLEPFESVAADLQVQVRQLAGKG